MTLRTELERLLLAGQYKHMIEIAPQRFQASENPDERVWVAITACKAAGAVGQWSAAMRWAEQGLELSSLSEEALALLCFYGGTAHLYGGDPHLSDRHLRRFLELAGRTDTVAKLLPDGFFSLMYTMRYLCRVDEERRFAKEAAAAYARHGRFSQVAQIYVDLAWAELHREELEAAAAALERAASFMNEHGDSELRIKQQLCLALTYQLESDFTQSNRVCEHLLTDPDLTIAQEADLAWILGRNALRLGDGAAARKWSERAYECAVEQWFPLQLAYVEQLRSSVTASKVGR